MILGIKDSIIAWIDQNTWVIGLAIIVAIVLLVILKLFGFSGSGHPHGGGGRGRFSGDGIYHNSPGAAYRNGPASSRANRGGFSTHRK